MSRLRGNTNREFTVVIYEADYKELCSWVLKKPDIETGGDLFGLWADKSTAVGKNCRRTSVSFYQDVDYLKRVGSYLTEKEGLCHIGEWHSHHTLGLSRPSGGAKHLPPEGTPHPEAGDGNSSRAGGIERNSRGSSPSIVPLTPHPPSGTAVERRQAGSKRRKQRLLSISHRGTGYETRDVFGAPPAGHPSRRRSPTRGTSTDVRQCTRGEKWYTCEEGQSRIKLILDGLKDQQEVKMDRHKETEDLSIRFKCHLRKWIIEFPIDFPQSDVTLKGPNFNEEVKINRGTLSMTDLTKEILRNVRNHCPKCPPPKPPTLQSRSLLPRRRSRSIHYRKSQLESRQPWG